MTAINSSQIKASPPNPTHEVEKIRTQGAQTLGKFYAHLRGHILEEQKKREIRKRFSWFRTARSQQGFRAKVQWKRKRKTREKKKKKKNNNRIRNS
jgi:hypothetical protein